MDAVPLLTNHFKWKTEVNFSTNRNKIISLHEALKEFLYGPTSFSSSYAMKLVKGGSIGDIYGKAFVRDDAGNIVYGTEGDNTGMPLVEGDGNTVKVGNANPKLMLGWNHMLSYKNFLSIFWWIVALEAIFCPRRRRIWICMAFLKSRPGPGTKVM